MMVTLVTLHNRMSLSALPTATRTVSAQSGVEIWPWVEPPKLQPLTASLRILRRGDVVWYLIVFMNGLLVLRIFGQLLGWQSVMLVHLLLALTNPLVTTFKGISVNPILGRATLDASAIFALSIYTAMAWVIASKLALLSPSKAQ
jgi:hypothetical protein